MEVNVRSKIDTKFYCLTASQAVYFTHKNRVIRLFLDLGSIRLGVLSHTGSRTCHHCDTQISSELIRTTELLLFGCCP